MPKKRSFFLQEPYRVFRLLKDYLSTAWLFRNLGQTVTVFGSARPKPNSEYYQLGTDMGKALSDAGYAVMTGAGPGLMEAVNKGAYTSGGHSVGCGIYIPREQAANAFLHKTRTLTLFFIRKLMLTKHSLAFVVLPGGYGTLDELFEIATLMCTERMPKHPIILVNKSYWAPFLLCLNDTLLKHGMIDKKEFDALQLVDTVEEAVTIINNHVSSLAE